MLKPLRRAVRDALDIVRRARSCKELLRALLPARYQKRVVLNAEGPGDGAEPAPQALAEELRRLCNRLKGAAIDDEGRVVYSALAGTELFAQLEALARSLHLVRADDFADDDQRNAFWINLYNVLAIHGVIALGIETSVMEIPSFFSRVAYRVGVDTFTLDEMENGVLRVNAPHPATGSRLFASDDARLPYCVTEVDPRIHAALVCASVSCPPVAFYDPERLDTQLQAAAANHVAAEVLVREDRAHIPITFRYYARDYGGDEGVWRYLLAYSEGSQRDQLQAVQASGAPLEYRRYDWSLNAVFLAR